MIQTANGLSATIGQLAEHVQVLRAQADEDIGRTVAEINAELQAIDELNGEIERLAHLGQVGPELLDRRDALIRSLAEKIDIRTFVQEDNRIAIYTAGGETLLDALPRVVAYNPAATVTHGTTFGRIAIFREDQIDPATGQPIDPTAGIQLVSSGVRASLTPELQNDATPDASQLIASRLRGGRLQGLLEARDLLLPELDDQIQELADNLRFVLNAAHNDGSPWPPPAQLTGTRTDLSAFAGATRSGLATMAVVDRTDGSTLAAFQIDVAAAADAAALAAQINAGLGGLGSAAIGPDGNLEVTLSDPDQGLALAEGDSRITITDAAGRDRDYGFAHYFGLNDLFVLSGNRPSTLAVRPDLASDPARLQQRSARRADRTAARHARRPRGQPRRPGAGHGAGCAARLSGTRRSAGPAGDARRLCRRPGRASCHAGAARRRCRPARPRAGGCARVPRSRGIGGQPR